MAWRGRFARVLASAVACRRPSGVRRTRGKRPYRMLPGLCASPWRASQTVVSVNNNLRHGIEDAQHDARGEHASRNAVFLKDLVQQLVAFFEHLEYDRHDDDRDNGPQDGAAERLKETDQFLGHQRFWAS